MRVSNRKLCIPKPRKVLFLFYLQGFRRCESALNRILRKVPPYRWLLIGNDKNRVAFPLFLNPLRHSLKFSFSVLLALYQKALQVCWLASDKTLFLYFLAATGLFPPYRVY